MYTVNLSSPVVDIPIGAVSPTSLTQVRSQSDAGCFATGRAGVHIGGAMVFYLTYTHIHIYAGCFATGRAGVHIPIGGAMVCPIGGAGVHIGGVPVFTGRSCRSCSCGVTVSRSQHAAHRQAPGTVPLAINFSRPSEVKEFAFVFCTIIWSRPLSWWSNAFGRVSMVPQGGKGISFTKTWYHSRYYIGDDNTAISYKKGDEKQVQLDHQR